MMERVEEIWKNDCHFRLFGRVENVRKEKGRDEYPPSWPTNKR